VNRTGVVAKFSKGILMIVLPKSVQADSRKKSEVKAA
jgi:HSP20 family molecular chaperone IbpA